MLSQKLKWNPNMPLQGWVEGGGGNKVSWALNLLYLTTLMFLRDYQ